ncbi:Predicted metal-binding protein related to the C-terminal domain of SecA [uncultured Eubacterium sp.]|nr:Predicted metal-binding protein related to the C-terminal domain of SecA [uncultured Eubacterium sp.]
MSLFQDWKELMENQTEDTFENFWKEYSETETKIYTHILENHQEHLSGTIDELVAKFQCNKTIFVGFLDGINSSLKAEMDLDAVTEETAIDLDIDFEKLFFNMLKAEAEYLFTLPAWDDVLSEEKRIEIIKEFKRSKTVHAEKKPGRNDPCPCGSGKKYKKCCGKNA